MSPRGGSLPKLLTANDERHGTYAGWSAHRREGSMCDACREAHNAYLRAQDRKYVPRGPESRARERAKTRLLHEFPDRFAVLYAEELERDV